MSNSTNRINNSIRSKLVMCFMLFRLASFQRRAYYITFCIYKQAFSAKKNAKKKMRQGVRTTLPHCLATQKMIFTPPADLH